MKVIVTMLMCSDRVGLDTGIEKPESKEAPKTSGQSNKRVLID